MLIKATALVLFIASVRGQVAWERAPLIERRTGQAMAHDGGRGRVVLFGGISGSAGPLLAETWEWDGATWSQRSPATSPAARFAHAVAFDAARGRTVLFGGKNAAGLLSDTW